MLSINDKYMSLIDKDNTHKSDLERKSLFYILAGNYDLYEKKHFIYDFEERSINLECLESDFLDFSTSARKLLELAFNHFNGMNKADVSEILSVLDEDNLKLAIDSMKIRYGLES